MTNGVGSYMEARVGAYKLKLVVRRGHLAASVWVCDGLRYGACWMRPRKGHNHVSYDTPKRHGAWFQGIGWM